jgi:hypothetical protein
VSLPAKQSHDTKSSISMTGADNTLARRDARKLLPAPLHPSTPTIRMPLTAGRPETEAAI